MLNIPPLAPFEIFVNLENIHSQYDDIDRVIPSFDEQKNGRPRRHCVNSSCKIFKTSIYNTTISFFLFHNGETRPLTCSLN